MEFNETTKFNTLEDAQARYLANDTRGVYKPANLQEGKRPMERGRTWRAPGPPRQSGRRGWFCS